MASSVSSISLRAATVASSTSAMANVYARPRGRFLLFLVQQCWAPTTSGGGVRGCELARVLASSLRLDVATGELYRGKPSRRRRQLRRSEVPLPGAAQSM